MPQAKCQAVHTKCGNIDYILLSKTNASLASFYYMTYFTALLIHCKAKTKFTHNKNIKRRSLINFRIILLYYSPKTKIDCFPLCERVRAFHQRCLLMKMHLDLELQNSTSTELMAPWGIVFAVLHFCTFFLGGRSKPKRQPYGQPLARTTV